MITFRHKGSFKHTENFIEVVKNRVYLKGLDRLGNRGVAALKEATPRDTGLTSNSWKYEIVESKNSVSIIWSNTNVNRYVNIAVILQYGHATRNGGWVAGVDYINPAMRPIFEQIANEAWEVVMTK